MFIDREEELKLLKELYCSKKFEFLVLYGRRRIGKTTLLKEFTKDKDVIYFSSQEKNDALNLSDFSSIVKSFFNGSHYVDFASWQNLLSYIGDKADDDNRIMLIIDEFPYLAMENPSIKSILQHTIDLSWKSKNIFLVLCGSSVNFIENEVLGSKSPLFGRATSKFELNGFDYYISSKFFPNYTNEEKILSYGILGGIPTYLEQFDSNKTIIENIADKILKTGAFLKDEPQTLLKMELRDPGVYNSILEIIADGSDKMSIISDKIHEESQKCSKYLSTLQTIRVVRKAVPLGETDASRKTIYQICDIYFQFWYKFLFKNKSRYEIIGETKAAEEIMKSDSISSYMKSIFVRICYEYMTIEAKEKRLPIIPDCIGKWWGINQSTKKHDDVDILALDRKNEKAVFCECKYSNELFGKSEFEDLVTSSNAFPEIKTKFFFLFSKSGFTDWVIKESQRRNDMKLIGLDDLFRI